MLLSVFSDTELFMITVVLFFAHYFCTVYVSLQGTRVDSSLPPLHRPTSCHLPNTSPTQLASGMAGGSMELSVDTGQIGDRRYR